MDQTHLQSLCILSDIGEVWNPQDVCQLLHIEQEDIKNRYSIPRINDLLDELHVVYFSRIDLFSSYYQIHMREQDVEKNTFYYHHKHYEFLVMSFGLTMLSHLPILHEPHLQQATVQVFDNILQ